MKKPYSTGCTQVCNQGRDCTCTRMVCEDAAPEGGNFYPKTPEPVTLNVFESIAIYLVIAALGLISFALIASGAGYLLLQFINRATS